MSGAFRRKMANKPLFVAIMVVYLAQALHGKTATFKVQVKNDGGVFSEVVKINLRKRTEKFAVPSQDGFQAAEIIHDFSKVTAAASRYTSRVPILEVWIIYQFANKLLSRFRLACRRLSFPGKVQESTEESQTE